MVMRQKKISVLKRVLIVDDDQDIRLALRALLRDAGYEVVGEAPDGRRAMDLMEKHSPSIVLLDILMPGTSGLDILVKIKEGFPLSKVVMISSDATSDHVTTALERGASGFIVKPFNFNNVMKNIERALIEAAAAAKKVQGDTSGEQLGLLNQPKGEDHNESKDSEPDSSSDSDLDSEKAEVSETPETKPGKEPETDADSNQAES